MSKKPTKWGYAFEFEETSLYAVEEKVRLAGGKCGPAWVLQALFSDRTDAKRWRWQQEQFVGISKTDLRVRTIHGEHPEVPF